MTVQLSTRPVLSHPESGGWCRTAVFSETPQSVSPEHQPVWVVVVAADLPGFEEKGLELLTHVEQTYQSLELRSPEALYQTLNQVPFAMDHVSVAAACFTPTTVTVMAQGQALIQLVRTGSSHTLIKHQAEAWEAVEGNWQAADVWWLQAGVSPITLDGRELADADTTFTQLGEQLVADTHQSSVIQAGLLVHMVGKSPSTPVQVAAPDLVQRKKRRILLLGWGVLILLLVSVLLGSRARESRLLEREYQRLSAEVEQSAAVTTALYETDQVRAREHMRVTLAALTAVKDDFAGDDAWLTRWQELYDQAYSRYQTISGEVLLGDIPVWYPLSAVKADFVGTSMTGCNDRLLVWDEATATLVLIDAANKRNDIVAGGAELMGLTAMACEGNRAVVLTNSGILTVSLTRRGTTMLIEADSDWQRPTVVGLYNNNIYLADEGTALIWRYPAVTGGVGAKQNWFGPGVSLPGTGYVRMAIDGQIWLLQSGGSISRYTRGAPQRFSFSGLDTAIGSQTPSFALATERDQLAVLDVDNTRVVMTTKNGDYTKQLVWDGFSTATDIAFSPNQDTLFVLREGGVYAVDY